MDTAFSGPGDNKEYSVQGPWTKQLIQFQGQMVIRRINAVKEALVLDKKIFLKSEKTDKRKISLLVFGCFSLGLISRGLTLQCLYTRAAVQRCCTAWPGWWPPM